MSVLPMLLPDQHYGHTCNRHCLAGRPITFLGACFGDLGPGVPAVAEDRDATLALAATAAEIRDDPQRFEAFADYMDAKLMRFMAAMPAEIELELRALRRMLRGRSLGSVTAQIERKIMRAAA